MKVTIVGSAHPLRGGLAAYNERLAKAFQQQGHEVSIYTFRLQYPGFLFPGKTQYSDAPPPKDLKIEVLVNSINPFNWIKVGRAIQRSRPDLVIIKYWLPFMAPCLGTIARIARGNGHTKVISIIDNIIPHERRVGDKLLSKYFVKSCDAFIAMSRSVMETMKMFDDKKPTVYCPHPLYDNFGAIISKEEAKVKLNLELNTNYLLFFGIIRPYKGLDMLLDAFYDERLRKYPLKLIIAGEYYQDPQPILDLIEKYKLKNRIISVNRFIPDQDVAAYFCASDIVVQPYKSATQSGITQIAYHFNKPMIVTNVGGLPEMVPNGEVGYVVDTVPKQIADAIVDYYENNREAAFTARVMEEKKKYSWEAMHGEIVTLYGEL